MNFRATAPIKAILAGHVLTMDDAPVPDGGVVWAGGRIVRVGRREDILRLRPAVIADDPRGILMPGLVNSHAHLELTGLGEKIPPRLPFTEWLWRIVREKKRLTGEKIRAGLRQGERQLLRSGVTAVADTASFPAAVGAPRILRTLIFREALGLRERVSLPRSRRRHARSGSISPHAPYSLSDSNLERISRWWNRHPASILSMHIAESPQERTYWLSGKGDFKRFYERLGLPVRDVPKISPIDHLDRLRMLRYGLLAVHANEVTEREAKLLETRNIAVAVCPGSLDYFGFSRRGAARLMAAGVPIVIGTDSLASNRELNLFREVRLAKKFWDLDAQEAVEAATVLPGKRLWRGAVGRLKPGCFADLLLVGRRGPGTDPFRDLLAGRAEERIRLRVLGGKTIDLPCPLK